MLHLQNFHAKNGEMVSCIFENCSSKSDNAGSLRVHFQKKHLKLKMCNLKQSNKVNLLSETGVLATDGDKTVDSFEDDGRSVYEDQEEYFPVRDIDSQESEEEEEDIDEVFLMAYCDFMNRLLNFQFIPQSSIQLICEEYLKNYLKSNAAKAKALRTSILKNIPNTSEENIQKVLKDFEENDSFLKAQRSLDSGYKRLQYLKSNFKYVEPEEILLNPNEVMKRKEPRAVMHYVPIIETVKNIVQDSTFLEVTENKFYDKSKAEIKDVKDGIIYKQNEYFKDNPEAMTLLLYSDGVELVNPLGAGRGKHKVIQIFLTFGEIPKYQRSKIDRIQLVAVLKEKLVKQFGFQRVYQRIVEDLIHLEKGINISYPVERVIKCGLLLHPADNLEGKIHLILLVLMREGFKQKKKKN